MSRHVALFPPSTCDADDSYPPQYRKSSTLPQGTNLTRSPLVFRKYRAPEKTVPSTDSVKQNGDVKLKLNTKDVIFGKLNKHSLRRCPTSRLNPVDFVPRYGNDTTLHLDQFPLSNENLASLSNFCFPGKQSYRCCLMCTVIMESVLDLIFV